MAVYGNNILVTFDMLIDTDIGLIDIIKNKYNDPTVFNNNILNLNDKYLKGLLRESNSSNPIDIILLEDNHKQAEVFYKELMEIEYKEIIKRSPITTIVDVIKRFIFTDGLIKVTILCNSDIEENKIREILQEDCSDDSYRIEVCKDWSQLDTSIYDTIFFKYLEDLLKFNQVVGKNLMVCDYKCNLDDDFYRLKQKIPRHEIATKFEQDNEFYTVTLYYYDESYYMDMNIDEREE